MLNNTSSFFRLLLASLVLTISSPTSAQTVEELTKNLYVPNAFSPDNDENNQVFLPIFSDPQLVTEYRLLIYNRKGEVIFESLDLREGWDGTKFGQGVESGVYLWTVEFRYLDEEKGQLFQGCVQAMP